MAQHAFWRENDQRLAPRAARLPSQHVEVLRRSGGLADLHVVFGGELQEAFESRARMLRSLAFVAVGQQHHDSRREIPFVLASADELIDDHLGAVGKISELSFPEDKRIGKIAAEAELEPHDGGFRERGV